MALEGKWSDSNQTTILAGKNRRRFTGKSLPIYFDQILKEFSNVSVFSSSTGRTRSTVGKFGIGAVIVPAKKTAARF
ncbi:MAG: hypothetical protein DMF04_00480 [Verrucomicrobia bacterium]|nr:MAG: hypothetical protein DMF04_00480 [Verrucomicrobiota bacterium]